MGGPCGEGELGQAGRGENEYGFGSFSDVPGKRGSASKRRGGFVDSREDFDFKGVGRTVDFEGLREGSWGWVDRKVVGKACKGFSFRQPMRLLIVLVRHSNLDRKTHLENARGAAHLHRIWVDHGTLLCSC